MDRLLRDAFVDQYLVLRVIFNHYPERRGLSSELLHLPFAFL